MQVTIETRITPRRRCGLRKPGGLYLVAPGPAEHCGKLPLELSRCPCCGAGIKPSRGWTWVDSEALFKDRPCENPKCVACPLKAGVGRAGLLWVGGCYYPTPQSFLEEAKAQGVSRRIAAVPRGFVLGQTWVLLAHRKCITAFLAPLEQAEQRPGIFRAFRPLKIEYVLRGDESEKKLETLAAQGITLVRDQQPETAKLPL